MGEIPNSARTCFAEALEVNTFMGIRVSNEVLRVGGFAELTAANSDKVGRKIRAGLNGHTTIEIDLSRTTFMDCTGLGALIALRNLALNLTHILGEVFTSHLIGAGGEQRAMRDLQILVRSPRRPALRPPCAGELLPIWLTSGLLAGQSDWSGHRFFFIATEDLQLFLSKER